MRSSWKLLYAIDDPYLVRVEQNTSNSDIVSKIIFNSHLIEDLLDITEAVTQSIVVQIGISNLNISLKLSLYQSSQENLSNIIEVAT